MGWLDRVKAYVEYDQKVGDITAANKPRLPTGNEVKSGVKAYLHSLFPVVNWITRYNLKWAYGDVVAGLTVGMVVVPQGMSYAKIATLPPEFGLYSSFVGVMIYAFFATSKDVTIGPVAVMSLQVSKVIAHVQAKPGGELYEGYVIGSALGLMCGIIVLFIGIVRLGWIIEFIPAPAISGFMTGSSISIIAGQTPGLMGYSKRLDTRAETYKVIINTLKNLPYTNLDAAYGLTGLVFLFATKAISGYYERNGRTNAIKKTAFFVNTLRTAFAIIIMTLASYLQNRHVDPKNYKISILKTVPSGFQHMGQPVFTRNLLSLMASELPVSVILVFLEHIAISKSFGRINGYKINPNQELIAIGVTNTVGSCFAAYAATGSFSRSAIKSKAGVRTPLAGWITGIVVIIALYALTGAFYWIPNAGLCAVIIQAVFDLIVSPKTAYGYWKISPFECIIFFVGVIVTIFTTIEIGIYTTIASSGALLLYRVARPRGHFLGRAVVESLPPASSQTNTLTRSIISRPIYLPLNSDGVRNPRSIVKPPPPGVFIYRFGESVLYPNAAYYTDIIADEIKRQTECGINYDNIPTGDRPWNNPGPSRWEIKRLKKLEAAGLAVQKEKKPALRAVIFDLTTVANLDTTSINNLVDLKKVLCHWVGPQGKVEFHFAGFQTEWVLRALYAGGFGDDTPRKIRDVGAAEATPKSDVEKGSLEDEDEKKGSVPAQSDEEQIRFDEPISLAENLHNNFHMDLESAVAAVVGNEW